MALQPVNHYNSRTFAVREVLFMSTRVRTALRRFVVGAGLIVGILAAVPVGGWAQNPCHRWAGEVGAL
jgi:hypothetical protein